MRVVLRGESDGQIRLEVSDTGVGLAADFETQRRNALGPLLVTDLARQLRGELEIGQGRASPWRSNPTRPHTPPPAKGPTGARGMSGLEETFYRFLLVGTRRHRPGFVMDRLASGSGFRLASTEQELLPCRQSNSLKLASLL